MKPNSSVTKEIEEIAEQLGLDITLLRNEILWALGEERINRATPTYEQFRKWCRQRDGLRKFWAFANSRLEAKVAQDEILDIWHCIDLTLNARKRRAFTFQEYLMIAVRSDQKCEICGKRPPEVTLEIDHILPVSKGGTELVFNLRFLCQYHNRARGNRFRWADIWRRL
jgi:5-methylcytosine-specific restriction endonuclease McrA